MKGIGHIIFMILLLISGIAYTLYNYSGSRISESMMILSIAVLGASLLNMLRGLIRALRDK